MTVEREALWALSHFEQAAATVTKVQLERIEELTGASFEAVGNIKSLAVPPRAQRDKAVQRRGFRVDPDRLVAVLKVMATFWTAFLIWLYVDPPGHEGFVQLSVTLSMAAAMFHVQRPSVIFLPFALGCAFAGLLYVFVMPQLSGYFELGLMIFAVTASVYYVFADPRQVLTKMGLIVPFIVLTSIQNEQTYSFAGYANATTMIMLIISLVVAISFLPPSPRPEKVFLRLFSRYFREVDFLLSRMAVDWEQKAGVADRLKVSLYHGDLMALSQKLTTASRQIDDRAFPDNSAEQVEALVASLTALAYRMKELVESRESPQSALLVRALLDDLRAWRLAIQQQIQLWVEDPEAAARESVDLQDRLRQRLARIESRFAETFATVGEGELGARDYENFYRLLGHFRGLSDAGIVFVEVARGINWRQWREARF